MVRTKLFSLLKKISDPEAVFFSFFFVVALSQGV
jgi:hypothetical protein